MLSDYDKERLRLKYEEFCYKNGFSSDVFDFNAELDSSLDYWEAWGNIEDKLELMKQTFISKSTITAIESKNYENDRPLILDLDKTDSVAILGDRSTGKSNLAFYLLRNYRGTKNVYLYGYPKKYKGFKSISTWTDILKITDGIIFVDEIQRYIKLWDKRANNELMELLCFLAHQNNTFIFTTQLSQFVTKGVEASIKTWLLKRLDVGSLKNGSKPKRILKDLAEARITDKGMALEVNETILWDNTLDIGANGIFTFDYQNILKDWKIATKTEPKTAIGTPSKSDLKTATDKEDKMKCEHKIVRWLNCEEHKEDCQEVVCCDCGESIPDEKIKDYTGGII